MNKTRIEWTDCSWNPVTGCTPVSEGCQNCYAQRMANRLRARYGYPKGDPFAPTIHGERLGDPEHWRKPRRVFVASMSDLFHGAFHQAWIEAILNTAWRVPQHTYIVLTKRPERMKALIPRWLDGCQPPDNLWLGVSVENQARANERIPILLQIPAAVRFVSVEPMLEPVRLGKHRPDWVIIGAESGPRRRFYSWDWANLLVKDCLEMNVPVFVKQLSVGGRVSHDPAEWPEELRIREFPKP